MMVGSQKVEIVATDQLLNLLSSIQGNSEADTSQAESNQKGVVADLGKSIGKLLEENSDVETLRAIDAHSLDIINLVTFLYEEIWQDETVPIPIKELIGRTQITILKIALNDASFFDIADHPARTLLNELATAGISWTDSEKQNEDPMYSKMKDIVNKLVGGYSDDLELVENLIDEFKGFKRDQLLARQEGEERLQDANERQNRLEDVNVYALHKIEERILNENIDSVVKEFLTNYFHKFVVQVVLREGPGGVSWKPVMNTIDVLLWTVNPDKNEGDLKRFIKINPRLIANLGKALEVAGIETSAAEDALRDLKHAQEKYFQGSVAVKQSEADDIGSEMESGSPLSEPKTSVKSLAEDDEHLIEVSKYPVGIWLEFQGDGEQTTRCTLAAKIDTIDKYVFVNAQGVKVIEKSKIGLARELKAGSVKVISEGPLIDRAMESVIGKLRASKSAA